MGRIADSTGIPLDGFMELASIDVRAEIGISGYGSAANTPRGGLLHRALVLAMRPVAPLVRRFVLRRQRRRARR